jgi:hypothetical protein
VSESLEAAIWGSLTRPHVLDHLKVVDSRHKLELLEPSVVLFLLLHVLTYHGSSQPTVQTK